MKLTLDDPIAEPEPFYEPKVRAAARASVTDPRRNYTNPFLRSSVSI